MPVDRTCTTGAIGTPKVTVLEVVLMADLFEVASQIHNSLEKINNLRSMVSKHLIARQELPLLREAASNVIADQRITSLPGVKPLVSQVKCLAETVEESLSERSASAVIEDCDQLRLRILAVTLCANSGSASDATSCRENVSIGPVLKTYSGLSFAVAGGNIIILLPDMPLVKICDLVAVDLLEVYESNYGRTANWIIDFSVVTSPLPVFFVGILRGYQEQMLKRGRTLTITWMRKTLFEEPFLSRLQKMFAMASVGGYLFSRENKQA